MKCNRKVDGGGLCGLRAALQVGIILRPRDVLSYAWEVGLQAYVCELHAKEITKEEILTEAHFTALADALRADVPYTALEPPTLETSAVVFYDIIEPKGEG